LICVKVGSPTGYTKSPLDIRNNPRGDKHLEEVPDRVGSRVAAGGVPTAAPDGQPTHSRLRAAVVKDALQRNGVLAATLKPSMF
jgi:hypothetical protein